MTHRKKKNTKIKQGKKTANKQVSRFFMPNEEYNPYNVSEQKASGESRNRKDLNKTVSNDSCTKLPLYHKSESY